VNLDRGVGSGASATIGMEFTTFNVALSIATKATSDKGSKRSLGAVLGNVHAATNQAVDQCPNDFGSIHGLAAGAPHVGGQPIEVENLSLK